jgi:hypothetical protein
MTSIGVTKERLHSEERKRIRYNKRDDKKLKSTKKQKGNREK